MAFLFIGAEAEDFTLSGGAAPDASTARVRSAYARTAVSAPGGTFGSAYAKAAFAASSTINVGARFQYNNTSTTGTVFAWLATGGSARLRLKIASGGSGVSTIAVESYTSGGSATTLATSVLTVTIGVLYKLDWLTTYGTSGRSRLYVDNVLFLDTGTMDITASGATTLNELYLAGPSSTTSFPGYWSEIIITDSEDTRPLGVKTLVPNATGDTTSWTSGTWADIDDVTASDTDIAVSDTAAQVLTVNATGMPSGASNLSIRALKSVAYVARGSGGPSKIDLGLRQSSTNAFVSSQTLDTGYGTFSATWTTNPITSATFTGAEIDAIQLAYRSAT
jgi:hypothetical protein